MNDEALPRQVHFLCDEAGECGKGANVVASRTHYFLENESTCTLTTVRDKIPLFTTCLGVECLRDLLDIPCKSTVLCRKEHHVFMQIEF